MKRRFMLFITAGFFFAVLVFPVSADPLRGEIAGFLKPGSSSSGEMRLENLSIVHMPDKTKLLDFLEIEITIPPEIRRYRDSFALYLYRNIRPEPDRDRSSYTGENILFEVVPATSKLFISIPLVPDLPVQTDFNSISLKTPVQRADFPLALTILPVMKGIPGHLYSQEFSLSVKPKYAQAGLISVAVIDKERGESVENGAPSVMINGDTMEYPVTEVRMKPGIHSLEITADGYIPYESSFAVESGMVRIVSAQLEPSKPKVYFEGPDASEVFLDGERIDYVPGKPVSTAPGEHIVVFQIGDYSLSKKFQVLGGKSYKISLFFDILVKEE